MTTAEDDDGRRRRRRRYIAPPQNLGPSAEAFFEVPSTTPAARPAEAGEAQPAAEPPAPREPTDLLPDRAVEDTGAAWGERGEEENDDRLHRDRPPHWG